MHRHTQHRGVQEAACQALCSLAYGTADQRQTVAEGGIECVTAAMQAHPTCRGVQEWACRLLYILAVSNPANQAHIARLGGIDRVLSAMTLHKKDAVVQQLACFALCELSGQSNLAARIKAAGSDTPRAPRSKFVATLHQIIVGIQCILILIAHNVVMIYVYMFVCSQAVKML